MKTTFFITALLIASLSLHARRKPKSLKEVVTDKVQAALVAMPKDQETCFSPDENCDQKLVKLIQSAQKSVDIAIYDLNHPQIVHEILVASRRVPVRVLVDRRQAKTEHSLVSTLVKAKVNVRVGKQRGIMHNKFTIVDGKMLETGSFNYTEGATYKNNENQLYLTAAPVVESYRQRFEKIWSEGTPLEPKEPSKAE